LLGPYLFNSTKCIKVLMKMPNYTPILCIGVINGMFNYKINSTYHLPLLVFNDPKCCKWPIIIHDIKYSNLIKTLALGSQPLSKAWKCFGNQTHSNKCERMSPNTPKWFSHFESFSPNITFLFLGQIWK